MNPYRHLSGNVDPDFPMILTAMGFRLVGCVPALLASNRSAARCLNSSSAIWLLQELAEHRKSTLIIPDSPAVRSRVSFSAGMAYHPSYA
jgi:hypothetical protein